MANEVKRVGVEDWLGAPPKPKKPAALRLNEYAPTSEEIDSLIADVAGDGKRLTAGLQRGVGALKDLAAAGFTFDLLVTMVMEKSPYPRGAKHKLSREQVIAALKGVFSIGEYLT